VGLVLRSVGYRGIPLPGLPFDDRRGVIPNVDGAVVTGAGSLTPIHGVYVSGWIKRGPQGVIGTNKSCAAQTVDHLLADAAAGRIPRAEGALPSIDELLRERGVAVTSWGDWLLLDQAEQERGAAAGRPREKVSSVVEMLEIIAARRTA
jgi:ferredoxin--NADP+ reductase